MEELILCYGTTNNITEQVNPPAPFSYFVALNKIQRFRKKFQSNNSKKGFFCTRKGMAGIFTSGLYFFEYPMVCDPYAFAVNCKTPDPLVIDQYPNSYGRTPFARFSAAPYPF